MAGYEPKELHLDQLLLDPNNYRLQDLPDFKSASTSRFHEPTVQAKAFQRLKDDGLVELKGSISRNGYIPVERIIVRTYEHSVDQFVVLEGNRRVAALKWLNEDYSNGVDLSESVVATFDAVPVVVATNVDEGQTDYLALMGIRHVSGIKRWGGYQEAKLIYDLKSKGLDAGDIGERLALQVQQVNRRLRAFKALRQMQEDEEYAAHARPELYSIFHEAVSLPVLRDWIGWDGDAFKQGENLHAFYTLIAGTPADDGEDGKPPKITTYSQVRDLRTIIPDETARAALFDPYKTLTEAAALAEQDRLASDWKTQIKEALRAIEKLPLAVVKDFEDNDIELLSNLKKMIGEALESHEKLK